MKKHCSQNGKLRELEKEQAAEHTGSEYLKLFQDALNRKEDELKRVRAELTKVSAQFEEHRKLKADELDNVKSQLAECRKQKISGCRDELVYFSNQYLLDNYDFMILILPDL